MLAPPQRPKMPSIWSCNVKGRIWSQRVTALGTGPAYARAALRPCARACCAVSEGTGHFIKTSLPYKVALYAPGTILPPFSEHLEPELKVESVFTSLERKEEMEQPAWMAKVAHRTVATNGISMHVVEQGAGPTVLLLHGFPEFWYSWRYQIPALADAGFHVVAPDLRGCGRTDAPEGVELYTSLHIVGDIVGLLEALGEKRVLVVGHDWGGGAAWDFCTFRPDLVEAVVCLSVPFHPRLPGGSSLQKMEKILGEGFYQCRFQEPGRAERDFERTGTRTSLEKILYSGVRQLPVAPEDKEVMESMPMPEKQPPWVTDFDIQYYTEDKERSGWTGGLNWYRCIDRSYELKAPWSGAGVSTKALFISGDNDLVLKFPGAKDFVDNRFKKFVPNLKDVVYLEDGGHFIQQEQATKVNELLIAFFKEHTVSSK